MSAVGKGSRRSFETLQLMMKRLDLRLINLLSATAIVVAAAFTAPGQTDQNKPRPLLQPINVYGAPTPTPDTSPFVKRTGSSSPAAAYPEPLPAARAVKTSIPLLAATAIPGTSGVLVETLEGSVVVESGSDQTYNPASNVKIATAFAVLKTFGPDYRFPTNVWTDGSYDQASGTIYGNLYVSGRDPVFGYEHAISIAESLNRIGIKTVNGNLVVTDNFAMNYTTSAARSSQTLLAAMDAAKRPAAATRSWTNYLINSGRFSQSLPVPSVTFTGGVSVQPMPGSAKLLFSHQSTPMREIIKMTMCYSSNFLAERLGDMLGGPSAIARIVQQSTGTQPSEFYIQTASGLGINRVTPRAMMKLLRKLRSELGRYRMTFADVMPVAGIDKGTLERRFDTDFAEGSIVGKTGTLSSTDAGVSALSGEMGTRGGNLLFVIFNQRGSVGRFRNFQNNYVSIIQGQLGGPAPILYTPVSLETRLARSRVVFSSYRAAGN